MGCVCGVYDFNIRYGLSCHTTLSHILLDDGLVFESKKRNRKKVWGSVVKYPSLHSYSLCVDQAMMKYIKKVRKQKKMKYKKEICYYREK